MGHQPRSKVPTLNFVFLLIRTKGFKDSSLVVFVVVVIIKYSLVKVDFH